uniref:Ras-related protein Rab-24 n=1 Tax=Octopus bimaculoides TaxID=37653 RepID=A0A0L8HII2_OCTBM
MSSKEIDIKVVLLGTAMVGKTSLVDRYLHERYLGDTVPYQNTIGGAFGQKTLEVCGKLIRLGIWDTAGSERYASLSRIYYRDAGAAIVCYDLSDKNTLERAKFWIEELKNNESDCRLYLCGTKKDLLQTQPCPQKVQRGDAEALGDNFSAEVFETSSKTGENIKELFLRIAEDYIQLWKKNKTIALSRGAEYGNSDDDSSGELNCNDVFLCVTTASYC